MTSRRGFLRLLAGASTTYFLPPIGGWQRTEFGLLTRKLTVADLELDVRELLELPVAFWNGTLPDRILIPVRNYELMVKSTREELIMELRR